MTGKMGMRPKWAQSCHAELAEQGHGARPTASAPLPLPGAAHARRYVSAGENEAMIYHGSCHCGAVQFEVEAPERIKCGDCNCSICSKSGYLHLIVPRSKFKLLKGEENLATYTFNTGVAQHKFCKTCGIKSFYIPRSNPDGYDVNIRCLEPQPKEQIIEPFDGKNWELHAHKLVHFSKET
jgi:hypothetical protein